MFILKISLNLALLPFPNLYNLVQLFWDIYYINLGYLTISVVNRIKQVVFFDQLFFENLNFKFCLSFYRRTLYEDKSTSNLYEYLNTNKIYNFFIFPYS